MKAKHKRLFDKIKKLNLHDMFYINAGGCGAFALMVMEIFKNVRVRRPLEVVYCDLNEPYAPYHIMLTDGEYYYDSDGQHTHRQVRREFEEFVIASEEELKELVDDPDNWNDDFNRNDIDEIKELVERAAISVKVLAA
jgi:hypothetical protein